MRIIKNLMIIVLFLTVLSACGITGTNDDSIKQVDEENKDDGLNTTLEERNVDQNSDKSDQAHETTTEEEQQSYMEEKLAESYFTEVEIEVEYGNGVEFEVKIERDDTLIKAKIDDEINNQKITGIDAFNFIYDRIDVLEITSSSHIDDVAEQIISSFELPEDYEEIEVEVKFHNGSELELEDKVY